MDSYFFIPGNKLHKIEAIKALQVAEIIIDMEDAVKESSRVEILKNLVANDDLKQHYIRIPLYSFDEKIDLRTLQELLNAGFQKFIFPKLNSLADFEIVLDSFKSKEIKIILLVETPLFFLQVQEVLTKYKNYFSGIGIGSHDFMSVIGGIHNLKNIEYIRQHILYLARAFDITAIDIASMELNDKESFEHEIIDGFQKGYEAKFFIHPWQIEVHRGINFYNAEDHKWALLIKDELDKVGNPNEFNPVVINGQIIERPHLNKMKKILKHYKL